MHPTPDPAWDPTRSAPSQRRTLHRVRPLRPVCLSGLDELGVTPLRKQREQGGRLLRSQLRPGGSLRRRERGARLDVLQLARALWPGEAVRRAAAGASLRAALPVRGDHVQHTPRPLRRIARGQAHYVGPAESHGEKTAHSCVSRNPSNQCNPRDPCRSSTRWRLQKTPTPGPHSSTARARSCSRTRTAAIGCCKTKYKSLWICAPSALPIQPPTHNRPADSPTHPVKPLDTPVRRDAGKKRPTTCWSCTTRC